MFFEARSEKDMGTLDVAMNVFKRLDMKWKGRDTLCGITKTPAQYSYLWDEVPDVIIPEEVHKFIEVYEQAKILYEQYLSGTLPEYSIGVCNTGATHYHRYDVTPDWADPITGSMKIKCGRRGAHVFYIGN